MKQDRFLIAILVSIGLLVVLAVVLFFVRQAPPEYQSEETPEGVVHNFILAMQQEDYEYAYRLIQAEENKPTFNKFTQTFISEGRYPENTSVQLGETYITGESARVDLTIIHSSNDPFNSTWDESSSAVLARQDGEWKIVSLPYPYWGWDWYTPTPKQ
jgi:hypothetical protein